MRICVDHLLRIICIAACLGGAAVASAQSTDDPIGRLFGGMQITGNLADTQSGAGMDLMQGVRPLFGARGDYTPLKRPPSSSLVADPLEFAAGPVFAARQWMQDQASTRLDIYDATVWQWATATTPGNIESGGVNRFNFRGDTKLWDIEGQGMGRFTYQYRYTSTYPAGRGELGQNVGSLVTLDSDYTSFGNRVVRFRYEQSLMDGHAMIAAGKINPNDYILNNPYAGDEVTQFLASIFDGNDAMPAGFQGYMPGAALLLIPAEGVYCDLIATAPLAAASSGLGFDDIGDGLYWFGAEAGLITSHADGTRPGKYAVVWSTTNCGNGTQSLSSQQSGSSVGFLAAQEVADNLGIFGEYVYAEPDLGAVKWEWAAGLSFDRPFDRKNDGIGFAVGMTAPSVSTEQIQTTLEWYYRIQVTDTLQVTPDLQFVIDPNDGGPSDDFIAVFGIRATVRF